MPIAGLSIGSFGDITTILQLAWAIRRVLIDCSRSATEINELIADIDSFTTALQQVRATLEVQYQVPVDIENGILYALGTCYTVLQKVEERLAVHRSANSPRSWRKRWNVCVWELFGGKLEMEKSRRRLLEQLDVIQTYLAALQSRRLSQLQRASERDNRTVVDVFNLVSQLSHRVGFGVPFHFFDDDGIAVQPLAAISFEELSVVLDMEDAIQRRGQAISWSMTISAGYMEDPVEPPYVGCASLTELIYMEAPSSAISLIPPEGEMWLSVYEMKIFVYQDGLSAVPRNILVSPVYDVSSNERAVSADRSNAMIGLLQSLANGSRPPLLNSGLWEVLADEIEGEDEALEQVTAGT
ncbi:hypothetical protein EXIGLDRAFT_841005 [Exidia glandulosa HHB12029]|uniref:Fungal N-terminal domain-containing protein n=1 Tax=Exidia glandulosa HHB12029 TaxID=1314781 RepID=A0A165E5B7_EXIGL|nr:hypothetical protein EXIGLDRAFT_841005 [Exidia glandulosa HHB12029]